MMRYIIIFLFLAWSFSSVMAEEVAVKVFDVEAQIDKIKTAEPSERRVLMNQLKLQLRKMNKENRESAMKALQKSFAKGKGLENHQHQHQQNLQEHSMFQHRQQHRMGNGQGK